MIPQVKDDLRHDFTLRRKPSKTYHLDLERGAVVGVTDGLEAVRQAIYAALQVERYCYPIYSWSHGVELEDLFGKPHTLCLPQLKRRITQALLQDDRITAVREFELAVEKKQIHAWFQVDTIYGQTQVERMVTI